MQKIVPTFQSHKLIPKILTHGFGGANFITKSAAEAGEGEIMMVPYKDSVTGNWFSGTATSGETGDDLLVIGADNWCKRIFSLMVNISNMTSLASVTIRMYHKINGVEEEVYNQTYDKDSDPDGIWVINGEAVISESLRVEVRSSASGDNSKEVKIEYVLDR